MHVILAFLCEIDGCDQMLAPHRGRNLDREFMRMLLNWAFADVHW